MAPAHQALASTLLTAGLSTAATTAALAAGGRADTGHSLAPLNAVSHMAWGDEALSREGWSRKHTAAGLALHSAAMLAWAGIFELGFGRRARAGNLPAALAGGAVVSAAAYLADYYVVPERLAPGFERRLTGRSMFAVYAVLAASLAVGGMLASRIVPADGSRNETHQNRW